MANNLSLQEVPHCDSDKILPGGTVSSSCYKDHGHHSLFRSLPLLVLFSLSVVSLLFVLVLTGSHLCFLSTHSPRFSLARDWMSMQPAMEKSKIYLSHFKVCFYLNVELGVKSITFTQKFSGVFLPSIIITSYVKSELGNKEETKTTIGQNTPPNYLTFSDKFSLKKYKNDGKEDECTYII